MIYRVRWTSRSRGPGVEEHLSDKKSPNQTSQKWVENRFFSFHVTSDSRIKTFSNDITAKPTTRRQRFRRVNDVNKTIFFFGRKNCVMHIAQYIMETIRYVLRRITRLKCHHMVDYHTSIYVPTT